MRAVILLALVSTVAVARADETADPLSRSYALEAKHDYSGAAKVMRMAATASPKNYFLALRAGYLSALAGDPAAAEEAYAAAATLEPRAVEPLLGEQLALVNLARWPDAITIGRKALALDPSSYLAGSRLAWSLYKAKDYAAATDGYRAVLVLYPGDVEMRLGLGWALLGAGKKTDAAQAFRDVLTMVPRHAGATDGLAAASR